MAFSYTGGATASGTGTSASVTHGQTINSGDLVVFYVNSNHNSTVPSPTADAGATWTTALAEKPSGETAHHALAWKIADGSEPSSYAWTVGNAQWRCMVKVFTSSADAVVDAAINSHIQGGSNNNIRVGATDSEVISDNAVSIAAGGKDNRITAETYTTADNSYVGAIGSCGDQAAGMAHRIYTTGTTFSGSVVIEPADTTDSLNDKTYSMHISFVEGSSGDDLLADDIESASNVDTPVIGQVHGLNASDIESASNVDTPAIGQEHALLATAIESASEVGAPVLASSGADALLADDIQSASEVDTPVIGQEHALLATAIESASEVDTPVIGQEHALLATAIESASEVGTPAVAQIHALLVTAIESASQVGTPVLAELGPDALLAEDIESISLVSSPALDGGAVAGNRQFMQNFI